MYTLQHQQSLLLGHSQTLKWGQSYRIEEWMTHLDLDTPSQLIVYSLLYAYTKQGQQLTFCSAQHISEMTLVARSTLPAIFRVLEQRGLIYRPLKHGPRLRIGVHKQRAEAKGHYIRIESWIPAYLGFNRPSELMIWASIHAYSHATYTVVFHRSELSSMVLMSRSSITRILSELAAKELIKCAAHPRPEGGKAIYARTVVPDSVLKQLNRWRTEKDVGKPESSYFLEDLIINSDTTSHITGMQDLNNLQEAIDSHRAKEEKHQSSDYLTMPEFHTNNVFESHYQADKKDDNVDDLSVDLTDKDREAWVDLKRCSIKPVSKYNTEAFVQYCRAIQRGYNGPQILDAYQRYRQDYFSLNDTPRYAKKLDRWLTEAGGLASYADSVSVPDSKEYKKPLSQLVLAYGQIIPELDVWGKEFCATDTSPERKKELAEKIRARCQNI